jgi:phosphoglycerol transferase MdoB-like AlkP superfamily enzyme
MPFARWPFRRALVTLPRQMNRRVEWFFEGCRLACRSTIVTALLLSGFRGAFLWAGGGPSTGTGRELASALLMGLRFDLKVGAVVALPLLLLGGAWAAGRTRWAAGWVAASTFAVVLTAMINHGYYQFYHSPIDPLVFGLVEDDTAAIFKSLWTDHHLVLAPLGAIGLAAAATGLTLRRPRWRPSLRAQAALAVAVPALLFLAARGRLGGFPLNQKDFTVSTDGLLRAAVPNGPIALLVAAGDRQKVNVGDDPLEGLRAAGFRRPAQAAAVLGLTAEDAGDEEVARALFRRTPPNDEAARHPPHVVLVVMESWGADVLRYHSPRNDLLGRLAPYLSRGLHFRRFFSSQNGTDLSLETLLFNTAITPLTAGDLGRVPFAQDAALPFRAAGYRTVFGMGWSSEWRGIGRAYTHQGFDEVADVATVQAAVPDAPAGTWGVPDGALFRWAAERLRQADEKGERLLLVLMTASNHSPYAIPADYAPRPLDLAAFEGRSMGEASLRLPSLLTYQYACDALGGFLDDVARLGLASRTIVAATGDHGTREFFRYPSTADLAWRDRVPFLLVAPPAYLQGRTPDLDRWAGHRDIFPTLAGLALSEASVFRSGQDLLAPPERPPYALARFSDVLTEVGAATDLGRAASCWSGGQSPAVDPGSKACLAELDARAREARAYKGLLDWNVRRQAIAARKRRHAALVEDGARVEAPPSGDGAR